MPTKTERILALLPGTFRPLPTPSALNSLLGAFGDELLRAENALAGLMQAHWVGYADRGRALPQDLTLLAALYGLAPRDDESAEEFREHLLRSVRTYLDGTVTVQGVLRVAAESIGLRIADAHPDLDTWWRRPGRDLITRVPDRRDAAPLVFGGPARAAGADPAVPVILGTVDLSTGVELGPAAVLRLAVDGGPPAEVDLGALAAGGPITAEQIVTAVGQQAPEVDAELSGGALRLAGRSAAATATLEVVEGRDDAAGAVLGLAPRTYRGADSVPARITGAVNLGPGVELAADGPRYLRIVLDVATRELDLGAGRHALDELVAAIDAAFGVPVAAADGGRLVITSPTVGPSSRVEVAAPGAQDAARVLLGDVARLALGAGARAARLVGTRDLTAGPLDLRGAGRLRLRLDGTEVEVDVSAVTSRIDLAAAIDVAAGAPVTALEGTGIVVVSPSAGAGAEVVLLRADALDAGEALFGLAPRFVPGRDGATARLVGAVPLGPGVDLTRQYLLGLRVDDGEPVEVDLRPADGRGRSVPAAQLVAAVEARLPGVASLEGDRLALAAPTGGAGGRVEVRALTRTLRRAFVTRARVVDEAAQALLGRVEAAATGTPAGPARVEGSIDLSRGSDLSTAAWLRLSVDGGPAVDVRCAGPRPRATVLDDVLAAIGSAFPAAPGLAAASGRRLVLTSPGAGAGSQLALDVPRPALTLLGLDGDPVAGLDATGVRLAGVADLSAGVDLPAHAAISLAVDGAPPVEVALTGDAADHLSLERIVIAVNAALLATVASRDTAHLLLRSPTTGAGSRLELAVPGGGTDVTAALLGFPAPRAYAGSAATAARLVATADLSAAPDVRWARRLLLTVNAGPPVPVDLAAAAADPRQASLVELVAAVDAAVPGVASAEHGHLVLTSPTTGSAARIGVAPDPVHDARQAVLGALPDVVSGRPAEPPALTGTVPLTGPVDLSRRSVLRLVVDGVVTDVDVAGPVASTTSPQEVVAAIEAVLPGTASLTDDDRLRLTGPAGASTLAVTALRHLELEEYPPAETPTTAGPFTVRHASTWTTVSDSAASEPMRVRVVPARGASGPGLSGAAGTVRALVVVPPGAALTLTAPPDGAGPDDPPVVTLARAGGPDVPVDAGDLRVEPAAGYRARDVLRLPVGRTTWRYVECAVDRFDHCRLGGPGVPGARFAGPPFADRAVLDISRLTTPERPAVLDGRPPQPDTPVEVTATWTPHRPGTLRVTLPLDLDERFGARFDAARFAHSDGGAERFTAAVCEPDDDERYLRTLIDSGYPGSATEPPVPSSRLVSTRLVDAVPLGFSAQPLPFRVPVRLRGGDPVTPSRLYLAEEGFGPRFLELAARAPGDAGNAIEVTARPAGPGRFDITVALRGARFESARAAVLGRPPAPRPQDALAPGAIGLRVTRAAGIACEVVRVDTGTPVADAAGPDAAGPDAAGPDAAGPDPAPPSVREGLVPVTAPHPVPPPTADIDKE